ncbi:photosystem I reaction center subunit V, chloroplastic [Humulus lupulus]|uniref:photosystem I reaction center subunit V, chloroplastic n=1 Tax=Humulus lupulus TaxID=3486 RepID=UPI002B4037AB|nr:photosystem I reaction center subunit V, chloroplastic [Humulus lupulus]
MAASSSSTMFSSAMSPATLQRPNAAAQLISPANLSFQGLRALPKQHHQTRAAMAVSSGSSRRSSSGTIKAELNPSLVISLSTGLSLFLGRFVFFNFQRENVAKQGLPEQNGVTHFDAGDVRAKEYVSLLKSNDPVGFNIVDVLAWGSIGHIVAYYVLATSSNGYDPSFF